MAEEGKQTGTKIAKAPPPDAYTLVRNAKSSLEAILPKGLDADRVIRGVRLALAQDSQLREAKPESVLLAVMRLAQLGLEANTPLRHAALVVYQALVRMRRIIP